MEGKAAVLGSADFVMPFAALGLDTFPTESDAERVQETAASRFEALTSPRQALGGLQVRRNTINHVTECMAGHNQQHVVSGFDRTYQVRLKFD